MHINICVCVSVRRRTVIWARSVLDKERKKIIRNLYNKLKTIYKRIYNIFNSTFLKSSFYNLIILKIRAIILFFIHKQLFE